MRRRRADGSTSACCSRAQPGSGGAGQVDGGPHGHALRADRRVPVRGRVPGRCCSRGRASQSAWWHCSSTSVGRCRCSQLVEALRESNARLASRTSVARTASAPGYLTGALSLCRRLLWPSGQRSVCSGSCWSDACPLEAGRRHHLLRAWPASRCSPARPAAATRREPGPATTRRGSRRRALVRVRAACVLARLRGGVPRPHRRRPFCSDGGRLLAARPPPAPRVRHRQRRAPARRLTVAPWLCVLVYASR